MEMFTEQQTNVQAALEDDTKALVCRAIKYTFQSDLVPTAATFEIRVANADKLVKDTRNAYLIRRQIKVSDRIVCIGDVTDVEAITSSAVEEALAFYSDARANFLCTI